MFTVICANFIDVEEFEGYVNLNVYTTGFENDNNCVILGSKSSVWSATHLNL